MGCARWKGPSWERMESMTPIQARQLSWICSECAIKIGAKTYPDHLATYHEGDACEVCQKETWTTEPRDFDWSEVIRA